MTATRDIVTGAALVALGILMIWIASGFPQIGAMSYGPDLFPRIIASGLILSGLGILLEAARGIAPESEGPRLAALPILILLALVAAFAVLLPLLGFHVAAALALLVAVRIFGGGWTVAGAVAILGPLALHYIFYSVLRVPLPWGLLTPVAW
ncbi:tripartite tricarboxylate transporter TctB family protein (plasmid) [Salipiger sp. H15]|uniref:Tripartite tricarboxylate transporter TctB family protein n=1 Tax=Alloyangia sp. H15 TaxID=3029062 RepID=A0AAU8AR56_9RHOB